MNHDANANEADVIEQTLEVGETEEPEEPTVVVGETEANPADLHEQSLPVPSEEEDWRDG